MAVSRTGLRLLAATPTDATAVPLRVARQLATAEGPTTGLLSLHGLEDDPEFEDVDLRLLLRDAVEEGRLSHELVRLQLVRPLPATPVLVRGVADSLARVLTNLVTNAAVHGGGTVWVDLEVRGGEVTVCVADDGPGLPPGSPLETGQRAHRHGGHGLGLVIARRVVVGHHGTIGHRSRAGGGTVVEITLPLHR